MQIRFGAITLLDVRPASSDITNIDLKLDGPDLITYEKLLGKNPVVKETNDLLQLKYRPGSILYGYTTHSSPHQAQTAERRHQQDLLNLLKEINPGKELRSDRRPLRLFDTRKALSQFGLAKRGYRTIFKKLLGQLKRDKVLEAPLIQGLLNTLQAIQQ